MNITAISNLYNEKVTVLNKIKGLDIGEKEDIWVKSIIDCAYWVASAQMTSLQSRWSSQFRSADDSNSDVITTQVLISDISKYLPYADFLGYIGEGDFYTMSLGDYIVKGLVLDEINSKNIRQIIQKYTPDVFRVTSINKPKDRGYNRVKLAVGGNF